MVYNVAPPTTVLASWEGVEILRGHESIWIVVDQCFEPDCFDEAVRLLGLADRDDYEIVYDPGTGREMFIFDVSPPIQASVCAVRDSDHVGVLPGLPAGSA